MYYNRPYLLLQASTACKIANFAIFGIKIEYYVRNSILQNAQNRHSEITDRRIRAVLVEFSDCEQFYEYGIHNVQLVGGYFHTTAFYLQKPLLGQLVGVGEESKKVCTVSTFKFR